MTAETLNFYGRSCPACGRSSNFLVQLASHAPEGYLSGRLTCPRCGVNLVVSASGHFVRDPVLPRPMINNQQLRRQSSPMSRLMRDVQPSVRACLGGLVLLTLLGMMWGKIWRYSVSIPTWPLETTQAAE